MNQRKRNINLDLIRVMAVFFVLSVHFFLQNGFYNEPVVGKRMFCMEVMRNVFIICVPLFLLLTGFLMNKKVICKKYYAGLKKTYITYVWASIACLVFLRVSTKQTIGLFMCVTKILNFSAASYSWYIEMYIGLFLLIPFINVLYNSLKSQKQKIVLIITMLTLTMLPSIMNIWGGSSLEIKDILFPQSSETLLKIIPEYWQNLWSLTYYFIGAYISEYGVKLKRSINIIMVIVCIGVFGVFNYMRSYQITYEVSTYNFYQGIQPVALSVLVFLLILHLNLEKIPRLLKRIIIKVSELSLGIYLVSSIFDFIIYPKLNAVVVEVPKRLERYIVVVPLVFILSLCTSAILDYINRVVSWCIRKMIFKLKKDSKNMELEELAGRKES